MGYSIDWSDLEQRIQDQKAALLDTSQNMDPERLKFLVETYDECKGESVFITRAKLFEKVLNNKKIYLDGNPIVGSLAGGRAMIYAYPEWQCNWVKDDLDSEKLALSSPRRSALLRRNQGNPEKGLQNVEGQDHVRPAPTSSTRSCTAATRNCS